MQVACAARNHEAPIERFAPAPTRLARRRAFDVALRQWRDAPPGLERDALLTLVHRHRVSACVDCSEASRTHDTPSNRRKRACKEYYESLKRDTQCVDCEETDPDVLRLVCKSEYTHLPLSQYHRWAARGGVDAMRRVQGDFFPRCGVCNRVARASTTQEEDDDELGQYLAMRKLAHRACDRCGRDVTDANHRGFCVDGAESVCGRVRDGSLPCADAKRLVDEACAARLLCACCKHRETLEGRADADNAHFERPCAGPGPPPLPETIVECVDDDL